MPIESLSRELILILEEAIAAVIYTAQPSIRSFLDASFWRLGRSVEDSIWLRMRSFGRDETG
jgi:hypothetical protein